jgi:crossover junction endodeoxyribonuclease RuvC
MRILAVDPGYDRLGIAVVELENGKEKLLHSACIETSRQDTLADRLFSIGESVRKLLKTYQPDGLAIENLFFNQNPSTAIPVAGVRGLIIYLARSQNCTVYEYGPQEIKVAVTGYGKSDKQAVFDMVKRLIPGIESGKLDDEYDAIAIGITCLAHNRNSAT